ncbi:MAG: ABC transporter ATP-binding protein [Microthrixaceae bacterium]|nr:ABC transporter ATP-binding protein [Microthrixaceae bacterium]
MWTNTSGGVVQSDSTGPPLRPDPPEALALSDVTVRFGGVSALNHVDLEVPSGQLCGLIGANGAGKTTLFDVISGLRVPYSGSVRLHGTDVTGWSVQRRARFGLRRTFQRVQVFGWLTVEENLLVANEWRGGGGGVLGDLIGLRSRANHERERRTRAEEVLARCGLLDIRDRSAASLPIGTARLVELARALMDDPTVLLLDEPASGLDSSEAERFGDLVTRIAEDHETAILLVEHDVGFVMQRCHRVMVLHLGEVLADDTPERVRDDPMVLSAYLGTSAD